MTHGPKYLTLASVNVEPYSVNEYYYFPERSRRPRRISHWSAGHSSKTSGGSDGLNTNMWLRIRAMSSGPD